jgi:hypothetical protein
MDRASSASVLNANFLLSLASDAVRFVFKLSAIPCPSVSCRSYHSSGDVTSHHSLLALGGDHALFVVLTDE